MVCPRSSWPNPPCNERGRPRAERPHARDDARLAVIQRFNFGELIRVLENEIPRRQMSLPRSLGVRRRQGPNSKRDGRRRRAVDVLFVTGGTRR